MSSLKKRRKPSDVHKELVYGGVWDAIITNNLSQIPEARAVETFLPFYIVYSQRPGFTRVTRCWGESSINAKLRGKSYITETIMFWKTVETISLAWQFGWIMKDLKWCTCSKLSPLMWIRCDGSCEIVKSRIWRVRLQTNSHDFRCNSV